MKVEVEVLNNFFDFTYNKERKVGDKFICDKELALKRKSFEFKGQSMPLVKILKDVANDTPEEPKAENNFLEQIKKAFNKEEQ